MVDERKYYKAIMDGARREGALLVRLHDAAYTGKKPFDMFGILPDGRALAVEVKDVNEVLGNPTRLLASHQISWLKAYDKRGGVALVIVHYGRDYYVYRMDSNGKLSFITILQQVGDTLFGIVSSCVD